MHQRKFTQEIDGMLFQTWTENDESTMCRNFPLHRCCRDGDVENLSLLLSLGRYCMLEEDCWYGWTPVHWASYSAQLACLQKVVSVLPTGNAILKSSKLSQTPCHLAAFAGHVHCLAWLLQVGQEIDSQDYLGETPLHKAVKSGKTECICLLICLSANTKILNKMGKSAVDLALINGHSSLAVFLQEAESYIANKEQSHLKNGNVSEFYNCLFMNGLNMDLLNPQSCLRLLSQRNGSKSLMDVNLSNSLKTSSKKRPTESIDSNRTKQIKIDSDDIQIVPYSESFMDTTSSPQSTQQNPSVALLPHQSESRAKEAHTEINRHRSRCLGHYI